jgi:hypothetical protein
LTQVATFMRKWQATDLFPVKVQVPIFMTVYALLTFKSFEKLDQRNRMPQSWFEVPADYELVSMEQVLNSFTNQV